VKRAPLSPDEATQRAQVRRTLDVLTVGAALAAALLAAQAIVTPNLAYWAMAAMVGGFGALLVAYPRRILARGRVEAAVTVMALAGIGVIVGAALVAPSGPLVVATMLIPITAALPYLGTKSLRRLIFIAWGGTLAAAVAGVVAGPSMFQVAESSSQLWGSAIVSGLVLFLLNLSSEKLKASSGEFRRLFSLSSDLAETTDPALLGDLVARHLAAATGLDDCVIYTHAPATSRLTQFGVHPPRPPSNAAGAAAERPILARVIRDRVRVVIDVADEDADPTERARLRALGQSVMVLIPLVAHVDPIGVAELTSARTRSIDVRRLELARTLAFEAAMAIENARLYDEVRHRSLHDPLTGLANRSLFTDRVEHAVARLARRPGGFIAILYIDLDNFKEVNDTLGHAQGDRVLALSAERLRIVVRATDTVARLGGDEFALLLEDLTNADEALGIAERAASVLRTTFDLDEKSVSLSASIGMAVQSDGSMSADQLIHKADVAMYEAKAAGKDRVVSSEPELVASA
jgi:diguanylate cyclase (GGDEF)-like protein